MAEAFQVAPQPMYSEGKPVRNPVYRRFIKRFRCVVCHQRWTTDACHTGAHGLSQKSSDLTCIPLCRKHHGEMDAAPAKFAEKHHLNIPSLIRHYLHFWNLNTAKENRTMTSSCQTCATVFACDRDEDGHSEIPGPAYANPSCSVWICAAGCAEHFSFACDGCGQTSCPRHATEMPDGANRPLKLCAVCTADAVLAELEDQEPDCTCQQTAADLFDARGCQLHDAMSAYNCKLRTFTAVQYGRAIKDVA